MFYFLHKNRLNKIQKKNKGIKAFVLKKLRETQTKMKISSSHYSKLSGEMSPMASKRYSPKNKITKHQRTTPLHLMVFSKSPKSRSACDRVAKRKFNCSPLKIDFERALCSSIDAPIDIEMMNEFHDLEPKCGNCDADMM